MPYKTKLESSQPKRKKVKRLGWGDLATKLRRMRTELGELSDPDRMPLSYAGHQMRRLYREEMAGALNCLGRTWRAADDLHQDEIRFPRLPPEKAQPSVESE